MSGDVAKEPHPIDIVLVGISFYSFKARFHWNISSRMCLVILFFIFAFLENCIWPMFNVLDITYTVGNAKIAEVFDFRPNEHLTDLFSFGLFEFVTWLIQALLAAYVGEKLITRKI